jgi:hypothetical protein
MRTAIAPHGSRLFAQRSLPAAWAVTTTANQRSFGKETRWDGSQEWGRDVGIEAARLNQSEI